MTVAAPTSAGVIAVPAVRARRVRPVPSRAIALAVLALIGALAVLGSGAAVCGGTGLDVAAIELPRVAPAA